MSAIDLGALHRFIVAAKDATYSRATPEQIPPTHCGPQTLTFESAPYAYADHFLGGSDFVGQAIVTLEGKPIWAMNYHGFTLSQEVEPQKLAEMLRASLRRVYHEERFLGEAMVTRGKFIYQDTNQGDVRRFQGEERIYYHGELVYKLWYHGGLIG